MTVSKAQEAAQQLRVALLDNGVRRVSIELQPGVGPKADPWGPAPFVRNLGHHIASYPPGTPGLGVVKGGRTGKSPLQGPLANGYGGFDLVARIITMAWANHPGAGGPWAVPGWGTIPKDHGRPYIFGWEFEGGYLPYTDEMHDFMARCGAGTLDWLGWLNNREPAPLECHDEHKGWAGPRKPDRIGYTTASGRARIQAVRTQEDDMYGENERAEVVGRLDETIGLLRAIHPAVAALHIGVLDPTGGLRTVVLQMAGREPVEVDAKELAATLAPLLAPALAAKTGASKADVEDAIRGVLGGLDGVTAA